MSEQRQKSDRRLMGTWRSDRRRTMLHFRPKPGCRPVAVRRLGALFGKLTVRWGRSRFWCELDGHKTDGTYEVIASDPTSVVIRYFEAGEYRHRQIHFEGKHYWFAVNARLVEFFRRVEEGPSKQP